MQTLGLGRIMKPLDKPATGVPAETERVVAVCGAAACFVAAVPAAFVLLLSVLVAWAVCVPTSRGSTGDRLFAVAAAGTATWGVGLLLVAGRDLLRHRFGRGCVQAVVGVACAGRTLCMMAYFVTG